MLAFLQISQILKLFYFLLSKNNRNIFKVDNKLEFNKPCIIHAKKL